jgi:hypothetical protein
LGSAQQAACTGCATHLRNWSLNLCSSNGRNGFFDNLLSFIQVGSVFVADFQKVAAQALAS